MNVDKINRDKIKEALDKTNINVLDEFKIIEYIDNLIEEYQVNLSRVGMLTSRISKALHLLKHNDIYDHTVFEEKMENILEGKDNE